MRLVLFVLLAAFVIVLLWIALANASEEVPLRVGFGEARPVPVAGVIVGGVFAGALFTGILAVFEGIALRLENRRLRRRGKKLEEEVHDLRNMVFSEETPRAPELTAGIASPDTEEFNET